MSENPIQADLSPAEWTLIQAIRALPESSLRDRTHEVLGGLMFYLQNPRCQGVGVDGFPCGEPVSSCAECHQIWDLLESIADQVGQAR